MPKLPVRDLGEVQIGGRAPQLLFFLAEIDSEQMRERVGREKLVSKTGPIEIVHGQRFRTSDGGSQSLRYLFRDDEGQLVGVAHLTKMGRRTVLSNLYVRPDYREKGIASQLVDYARREYPRLQVDHNMTDDGAKFFGYTNEMVAAHQARQAVAEATGRTAKLAPR